MRPATPPTSTCRPAPATALKLPKAFATFSALSSTAALAALVEARRHAVVPQFQQPARLEAGDQHDDRAVDNVGEAGAAAAEPGVGGGLQGDEDRRAPQRPPQRARAAHRG